MAESLYLDTMEHECLAPRTVEQWGHDPFYCDICHPGEFELRRAGGLYADMIIVGSRETHEQERTELRTKSVIGESG